MNNNQPVDIFISRKSQDAKYAKKIYDYLIEQGLNVFESDHSLRELGNAEYIKSIDSALERTQHLMVVASSGEYMRSSWVEAEWLFFLNRKRSGKASGNLFTVICGNMELDAVPASLQNYEVIPYNKENFPTIFNYCRKTNQDPIPQLDKPKPFKGIDYWSKKAVVAMFITVIAVLSLLTYMATRPFDATIFLKQADLNLSKAYPPFQKGELQLIVNGKAHSKEVLKNGEVNFTQLAYEAKGEWVQAEYFGAHWKIAQDSILLHSKVLLEMVPDGSLSNINGRLIGEDNNGLADIKIEIDNDTIIYTNENGVFDVSLPVSMQKESYTLIYSHPNFETIRANYMPGTKTEELLYRKEE